VSDNYPIGTKQNVNKHDSALQWRLSLRMVKLLLGRRRNPEESCEEKRESGERLLPNVENVLFMLSMEQNNLVVCPHKIYP